MPNLEKLIEKLKRNPTDVRFNIVKRVLEAHGYALDNVKGSHYKFSKPHHQSVHIVVHQKKVKRWYIKDMLKEINVII